MTTPYYMHESVVTVCRNGTVLIVTMELLVELHNDAVSGWDITLMKRCKFQYR